MSSNVIPFPSRKKVETVDQTLPTIPGIHSLIFSITDWAENNDVNVYSEDFVYFCADFMQRLQLMAYKAAA